MAKTDGFKEHLTFFWTLEGRIDLVTIAYMMGARGNYSTSARNLLERAVAQFKANLTERQVQELNEIRANVQITKGGRKERGGSRTRTPAKDGGVLEDGGDPPAES